MTTPDAPHWLDGVDPDLIDTRFGEEVVSAALAAPRLYATPPALDPSSRLVASIVPAPDGKRLSTPLKLSVRISRDVLDVSCACRHPRICEHVIWLLVDVAFHRALRDAITSRAPTDALAAELPRVRAAALEQRTLDERLAAWLPPRKLDADWEIDVDVITLATAAATEARAAVVLRHRRPAQRGLIPARDILAARLASRHRRLVELTAPYHLDKNVLIATRGQASIVAHLLREEIGIRAGAFKEHLRFAREPVRPRIERDGDRLFARWYAESGALVGDAGATSLLAGPFPYLWSPATFTFHEVAPEVDLDAALGLSRVPSLPLGEGTPIASVARCSCAGVALVSCCPSPRFLVFRRPRPRPSSFA